MPFVRVWNQKTKLVNILKEAVGGVVFVSDDACT
jgi:hypothetical protein